MCSPLGQGTLGREDLRVCLVVCVCLCVPGCVVKGGRGGYIVCENEDVIKIDL